MYKDPQLVTLVIDVVLVFLLLTFNMFHTFFSAFVVECEQANVFVGYFETCSKFF